MTIELWLWHCEITVNIALRGHRVQLSPNSRPIGWSSNRKIHLSNFSRLRRLPQKHFLRTERF